MIKIIIAFFKALLGIEPKTGNLPPPASAPIIPASSRFQACLAEVLKHEGGYVDDPRDPGGATNLGIAMATLAAWRGKPVTKQDVRDLSVAEAGAIYRARYWDQVRGDALPPGVDLVVFDAAVNSGPARSIQWLQAALGVPQDGAIGPVTLAAVRKVPPPHLVGELCSARMAFLRSLSTWQTFGRGWTARVDKVRAAALRAAL